MTSMLEAMADAVLAVDNDGVIRFANSHAANLTGYTAEELVGQNVSILVPISRRKNHQKYIDGYSRDKRARLMGDQRDLGLRMKSGLIVPVEISLNPIENSPESIVISVIRDRSDFERRSKEDILLAELETTVASEVELESVFNLLNTTLPTLFDYDRLVITASVPESNLIERLYVNGVTVPENDRGTRLAKPKKYGIGLRNQPTDIPVVSANDYVNPELQRIDSEMISWIKVPLGDPENPSGDLSIRSFKKNAYSSVDLQLLERVASRVSSAFENARLYTLVQQEMRMRTSLAKIGRAVSSSTNIAEFFGEFAELVRELIPFDALAYSDVDIEADTVTLRYWHGSNLVIPANQAGVGISGTIAKLAIEAGEPVLCPADSGQPVSAHTQAISSDVDLKLKETICAPLYSRGELFGCLYLGTETEGRLIDEHLTLAALVVDQISGAISNARHQEARIQAEKERLESELRQRELESLNEQRTEFISSVSHDLKTPLTSLVAFADILSKNLSGNFSDRELQQLDAMQRSAKHLDALINDLVDVSNFEHGTFKIVKDIFLVKHLIDEIQLTFEPILEPKHQTSSIVNSAETTLVNADRNRIAQLLTNLISNASKYSGENTQIEIAVSTVDEFLSIVVSDSGIGMDSETLDNVFTPFYRSNDELTQMEVGTGLGLAIVRQITDLHGGTISVASTVGLGTSIQVMLPGIHVPSKEPADGSARARA